MDGGRAVCGAGGILREGGSPLRDSGFGGTGRLAGGSSLGE